MHSRRTFFFISRPLGVRWLLRDEKPARPDVGRGASPALTGARPCRKHGQHAARWPHHAAGERRKRPTRPLHCRARRSLISRHGIVAVVPYLRWQCDILGTGKLS